MSDKVKLPREIVEELKRKEPYRTEGLAYLIWECTSGENKIAKWIDADNNNAFKLFQALVNGYEAEKSPEDKVREMIEHWELRRSEHADRSQVIDYDKFGARLYGAKYVLEVLGIKIDGVNS